MTVLLQALVVKICVKEIHNKSKIFKKQHIKASNKNVLEKNHKILGWPSKNLYYIDLSDRNILRFTSHISIWTNKLNSNNA